MFGDLAAASPRVSLEAIAVRDPDLVLLTVPEGEPRPRPDPSARIGWTAIPAVAEGRVRVLDADLLGRLGPRIVAATLELARAIHPEATDALSAIDSDPPRLVCP